MKTALLLSLISSLAAASPVFHPSTDAITKRQGDTIDPIRVSGGTYCGEAFITESDGDDIITNAVAYDPDLGNWLSDNICRAIDIEAIDEGVTIEDVAADIASSDLLATPVLKGKRVINSYTFRFKYFGKDGITNLDKLNFPVGNARLEKVYFYNGKTVTNSAGLVPDKASLDGEATALGTLIGWKFDGNQGSSEVDRYDPYNGDGSGAHISSRKVRMHWEPPVVGFALQNYQPDQIVELYIRVFADGKKPECRGGETCVSSGLNQS